MITFVTICKDDALGLAETYFSLQKQTFTDWQQIVVYAESHDETERVAKDIASKDSRVMVRRQKSKGIYAAMNEGLDLCNTSWVWFLNSADCLFDERTLFECSMVLRSQSAALIIGGYSYFMDGKLVSHRIRETKVRGARALAFSRRGLCHQSMIFNRDVLLSLGGYEKDLEYVADYKAVLLIAEKFPVLLYPAIFSRIDPFGGAPSNIETVAKLKYAVRKDLFGGYSDRIINVAFFTLLRSKLFYNRMLKKN